MNGMENIGLVAPTTGWMNGRENIGLVAPTQV